MKKLSVVALFFVFPFLTGNLWSQVQNKIEYHYATPHRAVLGSALLVYIFKSTEDVRDAVKIRGVDDSLTADNVIKVKLNTDSFTLFDMNGMRIVNDSQAVFYGTWYFKDYKLDSQEVKKNVIARKNNEGVIALMKVHANKDGRRYVNEWRLDDQVLVVDSQIISIYITNQDFWVDNERQKRKLVNRFNFTRGAIGTAAILATCFVILMQYK